MPDRRVLHQQVLLVPPPAATKLHLPVSRELPIGGGNVFDSVFKCTEYSSMENQGKP